MDVIGRRLPLTKKGNNYWSLCPFHDDNNPSMAVNEDKQFFYCFVCQESGNAIHFLREYEGLDFVDAVETLASSWAWKCRMKEHLKKIFRVTCLIQQ